MPDEVTLGEVMRRLEDVRQDLKEDISQLAVRLDGKVSVDVFELRLAAVVKEMEAATSRVTAMEQAQVERDRRRAADRRWVVAAIVVPLVLVFLQAYLTTQGATA